MLKKVLGNKHGMDVVEMIDCLPEGSATVTAIQHSDEGSHVLEMQEGARALICISSPTGEFQDGQTLLGAKHRFVIYGAISGGIIPVCHMGRWRLDPTTGDLQYGNTGYFIKPGEKDYLRASRERWGWNTHYGIVLIAYADECPESCEALDPQKLVTDDPIEANRNLRVITEIIRLTRRSKEATEANRAAAEVIRSVLLKEGSEGLGPLIDDRGAVRAQASRVAGRLREAYELLKPGEELDKKEFAH